MRWLKNRLEKGETAKRRHLAGPLMAGPKGRNGLEMNPAAAPKKDSFGRETTRFYSSLFRRNGGFLGKIFGEFKPVFPSSPEYSYL